MFARALTGVVVLGAVVLAAVAGFRFAVPYVPQLRSGTALERPLEIGDFTLVDQRGDPVRRATLEGRWSLLFLGFTHCPDVCPTTLASLQAVRSRLNPSGADVRFVFLTADPERDTPAVLASYLSAFDSRFLGLTGTSTAVREFAADLGLGFVRNPGVAGDYSVDHSTALVLMDPRARVAGYFQPPFDVERLAADLGTLPGSER